MKAEVLVAEIGSTTTVVNAFRGLDTENPEFFAQGQAPTSVLSGDVRIGLQGAIDDLCRRAGIDSLEYDTMLATSSAAGGLKMTVHGLVYDMTAKAAKEAALGAGGITHYVSAGRLRRTDLARIKEIQPNLILLAGGVDYGERDTAIYNAEMIRSLGLKTPVVYAGNIENQEEMKLIFDEDSGIQLYNIENVYPRIDELNVEPCRRIIQDAFEAHITGAPGMEHVRDMVNGPIIPTPGAVMECTKLLYDCIGDLVVLDVGGATTDLHSVTEDSDMISRILTAPEPKAKRTVEGDLGVYVNRDKVIESMGEEEFREACEKVGIDPDKTLAGYDSIPKTEDEVKLVEILAQEAVLKAFERHAGQIRYVYGPSGRVTLAEGKDLTQLRYIVGTGGALTRLPHRVEMIKAVLSDNESGMKLYPSDSVEILLDNDYIMASLGVLSMTHREGAIKLLEKSLRIKFPSKLFADALREKRSAVAELHAMSAERKKHDEEIAAHIRECEEAGYDMSAYKNPEPIGGATREEIEAVKRETLMKDRSMPKTTVKNAPEPARPARDLPQSAIPGCNRECKTCSRIHCQFRNKI